MGAVAGGQWPSPRFPIHRAGMLMSERINISEASAINLTRSSAAGAAILRKWPSLNNRRRTGVVGPYLLLESTLDACLQEFMAKPAPMRHLYEVHTSPQPPLVSAVLSEEIVAELARLRDFL